MIDYLLYFTYYAVRKYTDKDHPLFLAPFAFAFSTGLHYLSLASLINLLFGDKHIPVLPYEFFPEEFQDAVWTIYVVLLFLLSHILFRIRFKNYIEKYEGENSTVKKFNPWWGWLYFVSSGILFMLLIFIKCAQNNGLI